MIRSPLIAKIKRTSVLVSGERRLEEDLHTIRRLAALLEKESHMLANYKPLSQRASGDVEGDVKMESPIKESGGGDDEQTNQSGIKAVEARLEKLLPPADNEEAKPQRVCIPQVFQSVYSCAFCLCPSTAFHDCRLIPRLPPLCILLLLLLRGYRRSSR